MLPAVLINSTRRSQAALARVEALAEAMGMSKAQAAVYLIEHSPESLATLTRRMPAHENHPTAE